MLVFNILKNQKEANIIDQTEWLDEDSSLDNLYEEYQQKYEIIKSQLIKEVGQPVHNNNLLVNNSLTLDLIEYSFFQWQDNYYILGYGQHDQETPIFLISQKLT